jgi:glycosyltransferase involved in cell wall biosynthesis
MKSTRPAPRSAPSSESDDVTTPVVTTAIPVYNGGELFRPTLESLANQTRRPDRVIIQDNCSTDGTRDLVKEYSDKYGFELIRNETNVGHSKNLNKCLSWADQTDYLHILLADDLVKPTFIEKCLTALADVTGRGIAYAPFEVIDEQGNLMGDAADFECAHTPVPGGGYIDVPKQQYLAAQAELQTALVPAVLMKTNRLPCPMEFRTDMSQVGDCVFYGEWGALCEGIREVREILCQYRRHSGATTNRNFMNIDAWVLDEWKVMRTVGELIDEGTLPKWLRRQRHLCLFAARTAVKIELLKQEQPDHAKAIRSAARNITPSLHWLLGTFAFHLKNLLRPS